LSFGARFNLAQRRTETNRHIAHRGFRSGERFAGGDKAKLTPHKIYQTNFGERTPNIGDQE
jgi:hypothetical protein